MLTVWASRMVTAVPLNLVCRSAFKDSEVIDRRVGAAISTPRHCDEACVEVVCVGHGLRPIVPLETRLKASGGHPISA